LARLLYQAGKRAKVAEPSSHRNWGARSQTDEYCRRSGTSAFARHSSRQFTFREIVAMRILAVVTTSLFLTLAAAGAQPIEWQQYESPEYGYAIELPLGLFTGDSNGDAAITLLENDGRGQIDVYGAVNTQNLSPRDFEAALSEAERIREITYARRGSSWFVISGYYRREGEESDDLIFYAKFMFSADRNLVSAFEASYPVADKRRFDPIIERMEDSLTAPRSSAE
jgi:hypothetical protein